MSWGGARFTQAVAKKFGDGDDLTAWKALDARYTTEVRNKQKRGDPVNEATRKELFEQYNDWRVKVYGVKKAVVQRLSESSKTASQVYHQIKRG